KVSDVFSRVIDPSISTTGKYSARLTPTCAAWARAKYHASRVRGLFLRPTSTSCGSDSVVPGFVYSSGTSTFFSDSGACGGRPSGGGVHGIPGAGAREFEIVRSGVKCEQPAARRAEAAARETTLTEALIREIARRLS